MMRHSILTLAVLALVAIPGVAQYSPSPGSEDVYQFRSPLFLGKQFSVTSDESPTGDLMNPAASALKQRVTLDLSYIGLTGFGKRSEDAGWQGHGVNAGAIIPTRAGVIASSVHFLRSPLAAMPLGGTLTAHGSFSKELYPDWLVGAGVTVDLGAYEGEFDPGVGADLGIVHNVGDVAFLKDAKFGFSVLRLGLPYRPIPGGSGIPASFTPAIGAEGKIVKTDDVSISLSSTFSAPLAQNVRLNLGTDISFRDVVHLYGGWQVDARQLFDDAVEPRSVIPSFGISVNLNTNLRESESFIDQQGWNRSEIRTRTSAAPLYGDTWGFGGGVNIPLGVIDSEAPEISVDYDETEYISPNNDGTKDAITLPISIEDRRFVRGYELIIENESGEVVRTIRNKEDRPENEGVRSFFERVTSVKSGIPVPETLRWDGTTAEGNQVPDGQYTFRLEAWDDNGNRGQSVRHEIVIDKTAPEIEIGNIPEDSKIFSPNGDGNKDTVALPQSGSDELLWEAEIVNREGEPVRSWSWEDGSPEGIVWDGTNDDGTTVPDGVYTYRIDSEDRAGNRNRASVENIIVRTTATPIRIAISDSHISPNGDGTKDILIFQTDVPVRQGIVEWSVVVRDVGENPVRRFTGDEAPPQELVFRGNSADGSTLGEGRYSARFEVLYQNGNNPSHVSPEFTVDLTPPQASARADQQVFSPNGDGNKDSITLFHETSTEELWRGTIRTPDGAVVKTYSWRETAELTTVWDGRRDDGRLAEDGVYVYQLSATDRAGNTGMSSPISFELDTGETSVLLSAEYEAFSPNSDGTKDSLRFFPQVQRNNDVESYELRVVPVSEGEAGEGSEQAGAAQGSEGDAVRTISGRGSINDSFTWNGFRDNGNRAGNGEYRARIQVTYRNGNVERAATQTFILDTRAPQASLNAEYTLFSPDGDGNRDSVPIAADSSREEVWEGEIVDREGRSVRTFFWEGSLSDFRWDARDDFGNVVPNGSYTLRVAATDAAGNTGTASLAGLEVDARETPVFVTVDKSAFSPNGDGVAEEVSITMYTNIIEGVTSWTLDVVGSDGTVVQSYSGESAAPQESVTWDGEQESRRAPEGKYTARYSVTYLKGNQPAAETSEFLLDVSPPSAEVNLTPTPFSPDNDGVDDELHIGLDVSDASAIDEWTFTIRDRNDRLFNSFSGEGMPASEIIWNGRSRNGDLVISAEDYPYRFEITDSLGNKTVREGIIPVDILVVRENGQLKVRIANITFAPNSAELITDPETEQGAKNAAILDRLIEVFTKYSRYNIRVEGHAVNISGTEREQIEELVPLSRSRAETVRDALVDRGMDEDRLSVVGRGGEEPIVPHTDEEERWKNRRVEFILIR